MNILLINHYAGSPIYGMEFRPYYMAKEWFKLGHSVTILSASYSHLRSKNPALNSNKKTIENIKGINYVWYPTSPYNKNGIERVQNIFQFLRGLYFDTNNIVRDYTPDVVVASSTYPLDIWVAKRIARKSKAKLIYEVHDLWPLSPIELGGMSRRHPFILLCQAAEDYAYKYSDAVVSMLPKVHEHMQSRGLALNKLYIIPNGVVEEDWETDSIVNLDEGMLKDFIIKIKEQGKKIIGYTGAHGEPNALNFFLDVAKIFSDDDNVVFVLVGKGLEKGNLLNRKKEENLDNVYFFNPVTKYQIPILLSYFDILYIGLKHESLFRFGVSPNKLMDYMMAGKPICYAIKAGNDLVAEAGCGVSVEPENPEKIAKGIKKLLSLSEIERKQMGLRGKEYILKHQTYSKLADKFLEVMKNINIK